MKTITRRRLLVGSVVTVAAGAGLALGLTPQPPYDSPPERECSQDAENVRRILVAYASPCGSTAEIALEIGDVLCASGLIADVRPARAVRSLTGYDAVVLGSAIRMERPAGDARRFLSKHGATMATLPTAVFAVGMTLHEDTAESRETMRAYAQSLSAYGDPLSLGLFAGVFDPATVEPLLRPMLSSIEQAQMPTGDHRDWGAIRAWASDLAGRI